MLSPAVGRWFDATSRLRSVRASIFMQRSGVAAGCMCLWIMISRTVDARLKHGLFAIAMLLGCIARLAFVGKTAGIERDWVAPTETALI